MSNENGSSRGARLRRCVGWVATIGLCAVSLACVTPAEFRKVSNRVTDLERARSGGSGSSGRVADLGSRSRP
jgi:hypothetical protein